MSNNVFTAKNTFGAGLIQDLAPDNTQATCMTNALNATLKTNNGNELSLQNDMGNAKVELAELPEGYVPVGTCEFGGIIYIASYNPETNKSLIGCFPSPERVLGNENIDNINNFLLLEDFIDSENFTIVATKLISQITTTVLHPGDEYKIVGSEYDYNYIKYTLGVLDSNNKFIKLSDTINSEYVVYNSPYSSELYLQGELNVTDNFTIDYNIIVNNSGDKEIYPIFEINDDETNYKIKLETISTYAAPPTEGTTTETITEWIGSDIKNINSPFYIGDSNKIETFDFILYVKINGTYYQLMTKLITIDLSKVGTGITEIKKWRYFHNNDNLILDFLIEGYPKSGEDLGNIILEFKELYPIDKTNDNSTFKIEFSNEKYNRQEYLYLDYGVTYDSNIKGILEKDKVYEVSINGDLKKYLYTCPVFNGFWDKEAFKDDKYKGLLKDYSEVDSSYYYKKENSNIYPLRIKLKTTLQQDLIQTIPEQTINNYPSFVKEDETNVEKTHLLKIHQESDVMPVLTVESEFGDTFFSNITVTVPFTFGNISGNLESNKPVKIINKQYINVPITYNYFSDNIDIYNYKPLIYDKASLNDYGMNIDSNNILTRDKIDDNDIIPIFCFWSKTVNNRWGIQTNIGVLQNTELDTNLNSITDTEIIPNQGKNLEYLQNEELQNFLKQSKYTIFPVIIGSTGETRGSSVYLETTKLLESSKVEPGVLSNKQFQILFKDEDGDVIPTNTFIKYTNLTDLYKSLFTLLASIYRKANSIESKKCFTCGQYTFGTSLSVHASDGKFNWTNGIIYNNKKDVLNWEYYEDSFIKITDKNLKNDIVQIKEWFINDLNSRLSLPIGIKIGENIKFGQINTLCNYDGSSIELGILLREFNYSLSGEELILTPINSSTEELPKALLGDYISVYEYLTKSEGSENYAKNVSYSEVKNLLNTTNPIKVNTIGLQIHLKGILYHYYNITNLPDTVLSDYYNNVYLKGNEWKQLFEKLIFSINGDPIEIKDYNIKLTGNVLEGNSWGSYDDTSNECIINKVITVDKEINGGLKIECRLSNTDSPNISSPNNLSTSPSEMFNYSIVSISLENSLNSPNYLNIGKYLTLNQDDKLCLKSSVKNLPTNTYLDIRDPNRAYWHFNSNIKITN